MIPMPTLSIYGNRSFSSSFLSIFDSHRRHGGRIQRAKCWTKHIWSSGSWFNKNMPSSWWCHQMEKFSVLLVLCAGNSPVTGEFPAQRPGTRSFDVFFDLRPNERLSKQSWGWWFETPSRPLLPHRNVSSVGISEIRRLNDRKHIEKKYSAYNYANPVYGVATICHQVRCLCWGHPILLHTATSLNLI